MTDRRQLDITDAGGSVPAFTCIVYIRSQEGMVFARVANLDGIEASGDSERAVLGKVIPAFKKQVAALLAKDEPIPWVDPVGPPNEGEQKRIVPVHL